METCIFCAERLKRYFDTQQVYPYDGCFFDCPSCGTFCVEDSNLVNIKKFSIKNKKKISDYLKSCKRIKNKPIDLNEELIKNILKTEL